MQKKPAHLISLDFETTGLNPEADQIIEIGAVKFTEAGERIDTFQILAKPTVHIQPAAQKVHGITPEMLKDAVAPQEAWTAFLTWAGDTKTFVAHNAQFEGTFIRGMYTDSESMPDIEFICTLKVSKKRLKEETRYKLENLVPGEVRHRALADAEACITLYQRLAETYVSKKISRGTHAKPLSDYKTYKEPSSRQLGFIKSLGGDSSSVRTASEASQFIDALKARAEDSSYTSKQSTSSRAPKAGSNGRAINAVLGFLVIAAIVIAFAN